MILMTILMIMISVGILRLMLSLAWGIGKMVLGLIGFLLTPIFLILMMVGTVGADLINLILIGLLIYGIYYVIKNRETI